MSPAAADRAPVTIRPKMAPVTGDACHPAIESAAVTRPAGVEGCIRLVPVELGANRVEPDTSGRMATVDMTVVAIVRPRTDLAQAGMTPVTGLTILKLIGM